VVDIGQRGQQQHRHRIAGAAQRAQHGEPVQAGQHAVQHDRRVGFGGGHEQAIAAIVHAVDDVPVLAQSLGDVGRNLGIVLDDQYAHDGVAVAWVGQA